MAEKSSGFGSNPGTLTLAGVALAVSALSGGYQLVNPKGDIETVKRELKTEMMANWGVVTEFRKQVHSDFVTKESLRKDIDHLVEAVLELKRDRVLKELYDQQLASVNRSLDILRNRIMDLDKSVNVTYSARDALQQLQTRITDLERTLRDDKPRKVEIGK